MCVKDATSTNQRALLGKCHENRYICFIFWWVVYLWYLKCFQQCSNTKKSVILLKVCLHVAIACRETPDASPKSEEGSLQTWRHVHWRKFKTSPCLQTFVPESYDISSLNYVFCFLCFCETSSSRNKESGVVFPQFNQKRSPEELVYGAAMLVVTDSD